MDVALKDIHCHHLANGSLPDDAKKDSSSGEFRRRCSNSSRIASRCSQGCERNLFLLRHHMEVTPQIVSAARACSPPATTLADRWHLACRT